MINKKIFLSLILSIVFVIICHIYADNVRGYNSTGGEFFTIALPLWILRKKFRTIGHKM